MSTFQGMDVVEVRRIAATLAQQSATLDAAISRVDGLIAESMAVWQGRDALDFHDWWQQQHRPLLLAASTAVAGLGQSALNNAAAQEQTSGTLGLIGGAGGGGPIGVCEVPDPIPVGDADLLEFAKDSYAGTDGQLPDGWDRLDNDELRDLGIKPGDLTRHGLDAVIYSDGQGNYVVAFEGSKDGIADWGQTNGGNALNLRLGLPIKSGQAEAAVDLAVKLQQQVGSDHLQFTGHSLGGGQAALCAVATGAKAVTFNASPVTDENLMYARKFTDHPVGRVDSTYDGALDIMRIFGGNPMGVGDHIYNTTKQGNITNYHNTLDPLTAGSSVIGAHALGQQVAVHTLGTSGWGHSLDNFDGLISNGDSGGGSGGGGFSGGGGGGAGGGGF